MGDIVIGFLPILNNFKELGSILANVDFVTLPLPFLFFSFLFFFIKMDKVAEPPRASPEGVVLAKIVLILMLPPR